MKKIIYPFIRQLSGCLFFFVLGCGETPPHTIVKNNEEDSIARQARTTRARASILQAEKKVQSGYLITRTGNDFTSEGLRSLNRRNKIYSHCGIAIIEHGSLFVYHALGGEWNPDQKIRRDPFSQFADPENNRGIGIFRIELSEKEKENLVGVVHKLYSNGVMFDMDFDLNTDERMYCSEFVYKCLVKGSEGRLVFNHSYLKQFEFIGVDDIFLHPRCTPELEIVYK